MRSSHERIGLPRDHQLELIDVVRPGSQVVACPRVGPLVAVDDNVAPAQVQEIEQHLPLSLTELGGHTQLPCQRVHQLDLEAGHVPWRSRIGIGVRPAALHVAAVAEFARVPNAIEACAFSQRGELLASRDKTRQASTS